MKFNTLIAGLVAVVCSFNTLNVLAYEKGDYILRAGAASSQPSENSSGTHNLGLGNDEQLGLTGVYMLTNNVGIEVLASTPFTHDITLHGVGTVGEVKYLPPTVSAQYYFDTGSKFTPYVGAGINYWWAMESKATGVLAGVDLDIDDSIGLAFSAGVDFQLTDDLILNAAVWNIDIDTQVDGAGGAIDVSLDVDPWVYMIGLGYKF